MMKWYDPLLWAGETIWLLLLALFMIILEVFGWMVYRSTELPSLSGFIDRAGFALSTIPFRLKAIETEKQLKEAYYAKKKER